MFALGVLALVLTSSSLIHGRLLGHDEITVFFARYTFVADQIRSGQLPAWNPYVVSGLPQMADPVGLFYPFTIPSLLVLPVRDAINTVIVAHLLLAGASMYLYLRSLGGTRPARFVGAAVYLLSGFTSTRIFAGDIQRLEVYAWIPLLFFFFEEIAEGRGQAGAAVLGATVMACQFLAGDPQTFVYSCSALAVYAAVRLLYARRRGLAPVALTRRGGLLLLIFCFAALFSAIQVLPTLELLRLSNRTSAGSEFAFLGSMPPIGLVSLVAPRFFGDEIHGSWGELFAPEFYVHASTLYVGSFTLALILAAWLARKDRWPVRFFAWLGVAVLWVALGRFGYIYRLLRYLPLVGEFRDIENVNILLPMSGAVLAAFGLERFLEGDETPAFWMNVSRLIVVTAGAAVLGVETTFLRNRAALDRYMSAPILQMTGWNLVLMVVALLVSLGFLRWRARVRNPPAALTAGVIAFIVADLLYFGYPLAGTGTDIAKLVRDSRVARYLAQDHTLYRVYGFGDLSPVFGVQDVGGEAALLLGRVSQYTNFAQGFEVDRLNRPAGPHGVLLSGGLDSNLVALLNVKYFVKRSPTGTTVLRNPHVFPRVLDSYRYETIRDPEAILRTLDAPDYDPHRFIVLEQEPRPPAGVSSRGARAGTDAELSVDVYEPNRIAIRAHFYRPGFLLLNDVFYPAWHASLDGRPARVYRANYLFRAVAVPPGRHDVAFIYRDRELERGMLITGAAALAAIAAWMLDRRLLRGAGRFNGPARRRAPRPTGSATAATRSSRRID